MWRMILLCETNPPLAAYSRYNSAAALKPERSKRWPPRYQRSQVSRSLASRCSSSGESFNFMVVFQSCNEHQDITKKRRSPQVQGIVARMGRDCEGSSGRQPRARSAHKRIIVKTSLRHPAIAIRLGALRQHNRPAKTRRCRGSAAASDA
jgi:hypothetical protein